MNILYLAQRVPFPPNRGDKIASFNAVRFLSQRHAVYVAALADSYEESQHSQELSKHCAGIDVAIRHPLRARLNVAKALLNGAPLSVAHYESPELRRKIAARVQAVPFDAIITFSSSMGQYVDLVPRVPLIADFVDMDSRKWDLYATWSTWPRRMIYRTEAGRLLEYEKHLATRARVTLVRTKAERDDCRRLIPGPRFEVLSNGVDLDYFRPQGRKPGSANLVFTGVMDYFPNIQAVEWFANKVLPQVQRSVPEATFTIVGARPSSKVLALGLRPGVMVTGQVPDVRPYLQNAAVAVAPLLLARGIQNKVLEAMAMETPVVLTEAAFKGVDAADGEGILMGRNAEEFAEKVIKLLKNPEQRAEIGARGRRLVETRYVWNEQLSLLEDLLLELADEPREKREPENASRRVSPA